MKATIEGIEVEGAPTELAEFIRALQEDEKQGKNGRAADIDTAHLTPISREAFDVIAKHPNGMHYTVLSEELGINATTANGRCQTLRDKGIVERVESGVYRIKKQRKEQ